MNDARRVLHIPRRFVAEEWGGTETVLLEISRLQQREGWQPEILTSLALSDKRTDTIGGIPVRRFPYIYPFLALSAAERARLDKRGGNLISPGLLLALLQAKGVRLFHSHALGRVGGSVRAAALWRKKPWLLSLHGGVFDVPPAEHKAMMEPMNRHLDWGRPLDAWCGTRRLLEAADWIICVGLGEYEATEKHISHGRISYLPNGVDPEKFQFGDGQAFRRDHGIPQSCFLVTNISRISGQKNQLLLVEAFARLRAARPDSFLLLIGPETEPAYAARLRECITRHNLDDAVKILPGIRNDDPHLVNAYHATDLFVLPSLHEPFGIVVLEAWSSGRPVIASYVGGLRALVRDEENGLFFQPEGSDAAAQLAEKMSALAADPARRDFLGHNGLTEALQNYTWRATGQKLEQIYQSAEEYVARKNEK